MNMSDLISRQMAIDALCKKCSGGIKNCTLYPYCAEIDAVRYLPSAEQERKTGKWINYKDEHCCSVCQSVVIQMNWDDDSRYDYCPNCGAKMEADHG